MKKYLFFLCSLFLSLTGTTAYADTVSPYSFDFDATLETADHSFAPAGWGHIVDNLSKYGSTEWVEYKWDATSGIDDSGALKIGTQTLMVYDYDDDEYEKTCKDMLVTPAITGTSSIWVKRASSIKSGTISFYLVTEENGKLKAGDRISVTLPTLNASDYVQVNIPQQADGSRIGIVGDNVWIDNFSAASADVDMKSELKVASVKSNMPENYDADENGIFTVSFKVNVRNTGNVDLTKDLKNYSVSLINSTLNDSVMATVAIPQDLAAGDLSDDIVVSADMDVNKFPGEYLYKVRENFTGSTADGLKFRITPHEPVAKLLNEKATKEIAPNAVLYYGINPREATGTFTLKNDGGADLNVSAIAVPEGYAVNKLEAFTVAPHDTAKVIITMKADAPGQRKGELVIKSNAGDIKFLLDGEVADPAKMFVDFEDGIPSDFYDVTGGWQTDFNPSDLGMIGNTKAAYASYYSGAIKRLISPLVEVKEGETLRFIAARKDKNATLTVLYSPDRKTWKTARELSTTAENDADKLTDEIAIKGTYSSTYAYREYAVDNIPAGKYYIAFDDKNTYIDNIYGFEKVAVAHDIIFASSSVKSDGTVNTKMTARAKVVSMRAEAEEPEDYKLNLYVGDELVATADGQKLPQGKGVEFKVDFTPHKAGKQNVCFKFESDDYEVASDMMETEIAEETAESDVPAGNKTGFSYSDGPLYTYENSSQNEIIYKPADINIPVGGKISKITFKGYISYGNLDVNMRAYMESTDQTKFESAEVTADSTKMTKIFDGVVHFYEGGSEAEPLNQIEITFPEPYIYDGKGIHLLLVHSADTYKNIYWEIDGNVADQSIHNYKEWNNDKKVFAKLPIAYFGVLLEKRSLSGKVTDKTTGKALADAEVKLTNEGVEYSATTDADGKYSMTVFKYDRKYRVSAKKLGYYLEPVDSVEVKDTETTLNFAMTEAKHLQIAEAVAPAEGMVNYPYQMAVDVINYTATDKKADGYAINLMVNGVPSYGGYCVDIPAGEKTTIPLFYTPHKAGVDKITIELTADNETFSTPEREVAVAEEEAVVVKQIGDVLSDSKDCPFNSYWKHSESQTVYPASMLKLKKGMKITRIAYKGWTPGGINQKVKLWIENTADDNSTEMMMGDTTKMQVIYDGVMSLEKKQIGTPTEPEEVFAVDIPDGFVYTGGNIRIAGRGDVLDTGVAAINFSVDNSVTNTTYKRSSDSDIDSQSWTKAYNTPVIYLTVEYKYNVSGEVKNKKTEAPVADAQVRMESGSVLYLTTTDADGKYSLDILQPSLSYFMAVIAEGYKEASEDNVSSEDDIVKNFYLEEDKPTSIQGASFSDDASLSVYTIDGKFVCSGKNVLSKLANGTYILKNNATNETKKLIKQ